MLYNKDWDKPKVKADPFSLESLIAWLEKMPADYRYDFFDNTNCMVAQYVRNYDHCAGPAEGWGSCWYKVDGEVVNFNQFVSIANNGNSDFTFGAALTRAREALASRA